MKKYTIILLTVVTIFVIAEVGHTFQKNKTLFQGSILTDQYTPTKSLEAKEIYQPIKMGYLTKMQPGDVEYYINTKNGFVTEYGNVGIPSSDVTNKEVILNFDNVSKDNQGDLTIHGSVRFPNYVSDLHIISGLKYNNNDLIEANPAVPDRLAGDLVFDDGDAFKEEINHLSATYLNRDPSSLWFLATYQYKKGHIPVEKH